MTNRKTAVVVTGASSGIGAACALCLDQNGYRVFAGVRQVEDAERLRRAGSDSMQPVVLDVADDASLVRAANTIGREVAENGLAGLVNNAGVAVPGPLEFVPMDLVRRQVAVNLTGLIAATQTFLPLIRTGRGRVINIGSTQGLMAFPFFGVYSATKFAVEAISDSLRHELHGWDIPVVQVDPGRVSTPIWAKVQAGLDEVWQRMSPPARELYRRQFGSVRQRTESPRDHGVPPETVALVVHRVLRVRRPKRRYLVGSDAKRIGLAVRWLPAGIRDVLLRRKIDYPGAG